MAEKLTFPEAARYLGISMRALENYVNGGYYKKVAGKNVFVTKDYGFPAFFWRGGTRCFRRIDLDRWETSHGST